MIMGGDGRQNLGDEVRAHRLDAASDEVMAAEAAPAELIVLLGYRQLTLFEITHVFLHAPVPMLGLEHRQSAWRPVGIITRMLA
jgi:hypothetical protein